MKGLFGSILCYDKYKDLVILRIMVINVHWDVMLYSSEGKDQRFDVGWSLHL
jgi:hypothetical protein